MEESKKKIEKYMQEATERLNANDLDTAAFKVRKALEVLVKELCDEMEIEIKVKGKNRDSLNAIIGKIKETNAETRVLKLDDIESMYKVKQVGNIGSHDDDEKHFEKATGEIKVRNAVDTMYLLLESLSDNNKLKLKVSVNTMIEDAKRDNAETNKQPKLASASFQENTTQPVEREIVKPKAGKAKPISSVAKVPQREKKEKPVKQKKTSGILSKVLKSIVKWDVLIAILSFTLYATGGIKYAMYIGLAVMAVVDVAIIVRARSNPDKKPLNTFIFVLLSVLLLGLSVVGSYFISPAYAATNALHDGDAESAKTIIQQKVKGNTVQEIIFNKSVDSYYKKTVDEYKSGSLSDNDVKNRLDVLAKSLDSEIGKKASALIKSIDAFNQGKTFYESKNYTDAILMLSKVSDDFPKYNDAQEMMNKSKETYKDDLYKKVGTPTTLDECVNALELLIKANEALPSETDIEAKKEEITSTYLTLLDKEITKKTDIYDYEGATSLLVKARGLLGDINELKEMATKLADATPVSLFSLPQINAEDSSAPNDAVEDSHGNNYLKENAYLMEIWGDNRKPYVTYNLNGLYKHMKGIISIESNSDSRIKVVVTIVDGSGLELLKKEVTRDTKPIEVDLPINGTDKITIKAESQVSSIYDDGNGDVLLGEFYVFK